MSMLISYELNDMHDRKNVFHKIGKVRFTSRTICLRERFACLPSDFSLQRSTESFFLSDDIDDNDEEIGFE